MQTPVSEPDLWLSDRPVTITVVGASMEPFVREGDRVEVVRAAPASLRPGQLVVFRRAGEVVIHRFLGSRGGRFLEKGDAQAVGNWWPWPEALGVAVALKRDGGALDLTGPDALREAARKARRHLRAHRIQAAAARLPWSLPRRAFLRLFRPLL